MLAETKLFESLPSCYAGKILKINLTTKTTSIIPTEKYAAQYIGGRLMANKLYWDECRGKGVKALSAENTIIYMTGPLCGTGLPYSGRGIMTGISAKNIPEQYVHSCSGGYFGAVLKWAGYDGFMLTGKSDSLIYILIDDDKISFEDASELKGKYVIDTQEILRDKYGKNSSSLVIGPAGENCCRHASITTYADSAFAMPGFGAVWGYKNLKAIAVRGTGTIAPANIEKTIEIHHWPDSPKKGLPYPPKPMTRIEGSAECDVYADPHFFEYNSCNPGCNHICMASRAGLQDPLDPEGRNVTMVGKCMDIYAYAMKIDNQYCTGAYIDFPRQSVPGNYVWQFPQLADPDDPLADEYMKKYPGNILNMWGPNYERGKMIMWCCNQYGLDKWDITFWLFTWMYMCHEQGLFEEEGIDFGRKIDFDDPEFVKYILDCMTFRQGPMGDLLAEGVGRMIRKLGKEKFGSTIRPGVTNRAGEERNTPVSWETSWGESAHWQGRGFQGCEKSIWVGMNLMHMIGSRDEANGGHAHYHYDNYVKFKDDPCHSELCAEEMQFSIRRNEMKDSLLLCEWKDPDPGFPNIEIETFKAATGVDDITIEDFEHISDRGKLIERAIFMRDHDRTRDMEIMQVYPWMTFQDPWGDTVTWDEWNDFVDIYYKQQGWDLETGWPLRDTWKKFQLEDIEGELDKLGKIPVPDPDYTRKPDPLKKESKEL